MATDASTDYINSIDYKNWQGKIKDLVSISNESNSKAIASRRLRYQEIDVEGERKSGRLAPDELYIPIHLIDTNIRREQSSYVQYVTQSARAAVLKCVQQPALDASQLEVDTTLRLRYDGWQLSLYGCIDGFQQNGYAIMEVIQDQSKSGEIAHEYVPLGDFGFINDTKDLQECEMLVRKYYYSKTKLKAMAESGEFKKEQVDKVLGTETTSNTSNTDAAVDKKDVSLYVIYKAMFRVGGVVQVAWCCDDKADDWIRDPRPLFLGRRAVNGVNPETGLPNSEDVYEKNYPYFLFPYLISENNTISQLKGRVYLDQDVQEAASSLTSSFCTAHRRGSGLYFSKDTDDPNDDNELQKNVYFRQGALINKRIKQFQLAAPNADMLSGIQALITSNMQETSQVNFAAQNRKDSRKTATEISAATQSASALTTVQVVLFSSALRAMYQLMFDIVRSRVIAGLIKVEPVTQQLYTLTWQVKPSGDVDVIERQQIVGAMMNAWPVMQNTPAAVAFLSDLISKMFPDTAAKYIQIFQQAEQAKQQQQQSGQAQLMQQAQALAMKVVELSKHPEFFSDMGKEHALPIVQSAAGEIEQQMKAQGQGGQQR